MTSLRTIEGMDMRWIGNKWGDIELQRILKEATPFLKSGKLDSDGNVIVLTREGKLFADGISAELFA
jgi:oxygen-independent coproporphyrinogen-3 oxidase